MWSTAALLLALVQPDSNSACAPVAAFTQISASHVHVHRRLLGPDRPFDDPNHKNGMAIPSFTNGKVDGLKFFGVRKCSVLARLGFKNSDILRVVNDVDLVNAQTVEYALRVLNRLEPTDQLTVQLWRSGAALTLTLEID